MELIVGFKYLCWQHVHVLAFPSLLIASLSLEGAPIV